MLEKRGDKNKKDKRKKERRNVKGNGNKTAKLDAKKEIQAF